MAMTPAERERLTSYLAATRRQVRDTVRNLSATQLDYKPSPDRWSVAQILEHLTIAEVMLLGRIESALESSPSVSPSAWQGRNDALVEAIKNRTERVQTPDPARPLSRWPREELLPRFETARNRTIEFAATTNAPLRNFCFPHFVFGDLDCYQFLLAVAAHSERHHTQMLELLATPGFPRSPATS